MSGASMFVFPEIESDRYGEPPSTVWNDLHGISSILSTIRAHPSSRELDNYILSLEDSTNIRTGLIVGPLVYGRGEGPGNQRSIQAPNIARKTIEDGEGFRFRRGLNSWSNVHIKDLGDLFALLTKTALALDGTSTSTRTRTPATSWNETGIYLPANGDMMSFSVSSCPHDWLTFGKLCETIAREAHAQGLIEKDAIDRTIDVDEADAAMPGGAIFWGTNAVYKFSRAQVLLSWRPSAPSLEDPIAEMVRLER
ncbi:hypothetical protein LTR99_009625 [Exophiala xenobiotica]|nr:hypothetical protein LTR99_009625 [Exophiala xenobiotica]KAK5336120.1 hypothetical protein LTR98_007450 [Exophiala xenobiotica]KAK5555280.1 hypothetical protein LTR46_006910 [Exophiala xenobiotica]